MEKNILEKGVLIVEDNYELRSSVADLLISSGFNKIYQSGNMADCLSILSENGNDVYVVLLDLMLPDGTGLQIMEHLVNSHSNVVGVIIVTERSEVEFAKRFFKLGTDDVVAVDFQLKSNISYTQLFEQVGRTINLIDNKRRQQSTFVQNEMWQRMGILDSKITLLADQLQSLAHLEDHLRNIEKTISINDKKPIRTYPKNN